MILVCITGFLIVINILAMLQDDSIFLLIVTFIITIALLIPLGIGILSLLASVQKIRVTEKNFQILLGKKPVLTIPAERIRSVVATTREYREKMSDRDILVLYLYWEGKHPQNFGLCFQWSQETEDAFREKMPHVCMLM